MRYKAGYSGHDSMREKAEKAVGHEMHGLKNLDRDCYKSGGKMHHGRVKKDIGGEIQKAGIMGMPSYLVDKAMGSFKHGGKVHHKPVRKNMGGMMGAPMNTADSIQQANHILSNAAASGVGLKRGGKAHHMRHKRADGGPMSAASAMGNRDFELGKKAMGFRHGGKTGKAVHEIEIELINKIPRKGLNPFFEKHIHDANDRIKKAIGGVGKIRHGQMTRKGMQIAPRGRHKG